MWLVKSLVGDRPSWHKEPINILNKMLSIRKVRLLITSRYIAMQSYECVIISKMFLINFISYGCNGGQWRMQNVTDGWAWIKSRWAWIYGCSEIKAGFPDNVVS